MEQAWPGALRTAAPHPERTSEKPRQLRRVRQSDGGRSSWLRNLSLRWLPELSQIVLPDGLLLLGDPGFDLRMQYVKRQSTAIKDFIVEGAKVKLVAKLLARFFTQLENFQLTELVGERL